MVSERSVTGRPTFPFRSKTIGLFFSLALLAACGSKPAEPKANPKDEVVRFYRGVEAMFNSEAFRKDRHILFNDLDPSSKFRLFDLDLPREYRGDAARTHMYEISGQFIGKVTFEGLEVDANENVAFASYFQHVVGTDPRGNPLDVAVRTTDGLRKIDGRWYIMHQHNSLALDPATLGSVIAKKP